MITLALRLFAGNLFKTLTGDVIKGWEWIFSSATHILEAALLLAVLYGWHEHRAVASANAKWPGVITQWQQTDRTNHATIEQLLAALDVQSAHVRALADAGQLKQQAAQAALRAATGRAVQAEGLAARIDAERAVRGSGCTSGDAVMAARKAL